MNNQWQIIRKIGEGQYSKVYLIRKKIQDVERECVLKYIDYSDFSTNVALVEQLKNEIHIIQVVNNHKNIVCYYEFYNEEKSNSIFIIMELLKDIKSYYQDKTISESEVVRLGKDICNALKVFHENNLVHRDVKLSNIFVDSNSEYKLGDFGLSVSKDEKHFLGTPSYMAPEVLEGKVDGRSDLYSLGLVMYVLLNGGKLPFENHKINIYQAIEKRNQGAKIPRIKGVHRGLMKIVLHLLEFDLEKRYQSVDEVLKDLNALTGVKNSVKAKVELFHLDSTLDVHHLALSNKLYTNIDGIRRRYTKKDIIKGLLLGVVLLLCIISSSIVYLFNRSCDNGYVNKGGICVKGYYQCPKNYSLKGKKCVKIVEEIAARENYYCEDGYILNEGVCVNQNTKSPTFAYKCADGFTLSGSKCVREESAEAALIYYCPDNYVLAGTKCVTANSKEASVSYSCPDSSYVRKGDKCTTTKTTSSKAIVTYGCSLGGTLSGTTCDIVSNPTTSGGWWGGYRTSCTRGTYSYSDGKCHYTYAASASYTCTTGTSDGKGNCIRSANETVNAIATYNCPPGYLSVGNMCTSSATIDATPKYMCTTDTVLKGNMCYGTISSDALGIYQCPDGYVLGGTTCLKDDFKKPTVRYTCSRLYKLNEKKCQKYEEKKAQAIYEEDEK